MPLGAVRYPQYEDVEARLEPGASLVLYTDGVVERPGGPWTRVWSGCGSAVCHADREPRAMCDAIIRTMLPDGATRDDAALLVARALPLSDPLELSLPADVDTIPSLRRVLGRWLREAKRHRAGDRGDHTRLLGGVRQRDRACLPAGTGRPGGQRLGVEAREIVIRVRDFGSWRPARGSHRGRGMVLMQGLMESVDVDSGDAGTWSPVTAPRGRH